MAKIVMRHSDLNQTFPGQLGVILFAAWLSLIDVSLVNAQMPVVTTGAAPGYVEDITCKNCHPSHYESYQSVGMAQSFKKPGNAKLLEKFGETFFHEPSQRYYEINNRNDKLFFRRFQHDLNGDVINEIEIPVDWVLGSGNRTRSYLYQTELGEMFQLPIGWYSEGGFWEMSPGFESANHEGISRRIKRPCMFCHNAFPEVDQDAYADADLFPQHLPEGTGCQRCHGPGGEHVEQAYSGAPIEDIRFAIVNPANLEGERRESVCLQCHLLPTISIVMPLRFGRGTYSFRPGELLSDYLVNLDIREQGVDEPERFEINHHGHRFLKSACYQKSEGALGCISCHNPHLKPKSSEFRTKVAGVCKGCHTNLTHAFPIAENECVTCHMPTRRTKDVVHVTMTDHWIARGPFDLKAIVEPVQPETRAITSVEVLAFGKPPNGLDEQTYRSLGAMRAGRSVGDASAGLIKSLQQKDYDDYTPYLDLARAQLQQGDFSSAEAAARGLVNAEPGLYIAHTLLGLAQMSQGKYQKAKLSFRKSLEIQPDPETHFNLAAVYFGTRQLTLSELELDKAIHLRPYMARAYKMKGQIHLARNNKERARGAFETALQLDPGDSATYLLIVTLLKEMGEANDAKRFSELGQRASRHPPLLKE